MQNMTDMALLQEYGQSRNPEAFAELVRRHAGLVYSAAYRVTGNQHDAEDISQACFLELARRIDEVKTCVAGWLHTTATHRAISFCRKESTQRKYVKAAAAPEIEKADLTWEELKPEIDKAIAALPEELREPVVLRYLQGLSQGEVAAKLEVSQATISRRLDRGIVQLRQHLTEAGLDVSVASLSLLLMVDHMELVPATLQATLGKMALAGPGKLLAGSVNVKAVAVALALACLTLGTGTALWLAGASNSAAPSGASAMSTAAAKPGSRRIARVPSVGWGKGIDTTVMGAFWASTSISTQPVSYPTAMSVTGVAFRIRWFRGENDERGDGCAPIGEIDHEDQLLAQATGWRKIATNTDGDRALARTHIVQSIDAGRPVLAYDKMWNMGVVSGYEQQGEILLLQSYSTGPQPEPMALAALPPYFWIFTDPQPPLPPRDQLRQSLQMARSLWNRAPLPFEPRGEIRGALSHGADAYQLWIQDISDYDTLTPGQRKSVFFAGWWNFSCMWDARKAGISYLKDNLHLLKPSAQPHLQQAIATYQKLVDAMQGAFIGEKSNIFPGPWTNKSIADWTPEMRTREIDTLKTLQALDSQALAHLEAALQAENTE